MRMKMPIGIENYAKMIQEGYYFVDKTDFLRQLIDQHSEVMLFTRPRRFGKTLTLSMVDYFFSIEKRKQSLNLFERLAIAKAGKQYMSQRGQYPVLFVSLKNIEGMSWQQMLQGFRTWISNWCTQFGYLAKSPRIETELKKRFYALQMRESDEAETANALFLLMLMMQQHYGKKVILLIDEYDAPIETAWENGFYRECINFMRQFLGAALKTNPYLQFALLTGVLRVAKESIFSGLNNLSVYTVLNDNYADIFGFTATEVRQMAHDLRKEEQLTELQHWYDGYRFGKQDIYNPWSVINFFDQNELGDYWVNTSGNGIIRHMLSHLDAEKEKTLLSLLHGKSITTAIREGVIYEDIDNNEDTLYTMLLTTGYLTAVSKQRGISGLLAELAIPNREVQDIYRVEILERMKAGLSLAKLETMLSDLMNGRAEAFAERLTTYIQYLVSVYDAANKEGFYHGFLLGMTALLVPDYIVESNRESGYGRFDLAIFPRDTKKAGVVLEFKVAATEHDLSEKAQEALHQISNRQYLTEFAKRGVNNVWQYGIAFCGKKICVRRN